MDYLIEEVLHKQTQEVRDFLIKTSVLTRLSGPLCDAVTECQDSSDTLMELEQNHLFIVPLDESRNWYRYEHLFADILQHQLGKRHGDQEIIILHKRASQWYEDNDFPDDAIHHSLAAQDWERATRLTTVHGKKKAQSGQYVTLTNWLRQIPGEFLISAPRLYARYIIALLMVGEFSFAESRLSIFKKAAEGDDSVKGMIAHLESLVAARRYDMHLAEEWARKGLSLLPPVDDFYPSLNQLLGLIYTERGNYQEAEPLLTEAYTAARRAGSHFVEFSAFGHLAIIIFRKGELRRSADMAQQALERAGPSPSAAVLRMILSEIFYEWNDLETALDHVQRVIELGQQIGMMQARVKIRDILARIELSRGNEAGFLAALEKADLEARSISDRTPIWAEHSAHHVEFALARDDLADAIKWGVKLDENADFLPFQFKHFPSRLLIARGKKSEAADKLKELYDEVTQSGTQGLMIVYRLYQALAADNDELALEFLSDAMTMAEPEGYIRTFVDEGKLLKPLLQKALTEGITPEYTGKLLNIIEAEERMRKKARGGEIPLSERELEILRLLAADVSNQQIAEMLTISLSTVKTHVHHILEKLDAKDRSQAVFYARELELM